MSTSVPERLPPGARALTLSAVVIGRILATVVLLSYFILSIATEVASRCSSPSVSPAEGRPCTHLEAQLVTWLLAMAVLMLCWGWCRLVSWFGRRGVMVVWTRR